MVNVSTNIWPVSRKFPTLCNGGIEYEMSWAKSEGSGTALSRKRRSFVVAQLINNGHMSSRVPFIVSMVTGSHPHF